MARDDAQRKGTYHAPGREAAAQNTRRKIHNAARQLFLAQGYAATSIAQVAQAAGVTDRTVYLAFGNKVGLLESVMGIATVGDDLPVPLAARARMAEILQAQPRQQIELIAAWNTEISARMAGLSEMADAAAHADPEIKVLRDASRQRRLGDFRLMAQSLADKGTLRPGLTVDEAADILYTLNWDALYGVLVLQRGWSPDWYRAWLTQMLETALLSMEDSDSSGGQP